METVTELRKSGIKMSKKDEEIYDLTRHLDIAHNEIHRLEAELSEMKELLADNDIEFGDMINQSDRGNDMLHGG